MFRIFCTIAFFSISQLCQSEEFTTKQIIAGVNQARKQIENGEMRIIITFDYEAKKTSEEIQVLRQEEHQRILKEYPMPHQKAIREEELKEVPFYANWYEKRQVVEESNVAFRIFDRDSLHYPKIFQYKMNQIDRLKVDLFTEEAKYTTTGDYRVITYDGKTQAYEALDEFPAHSVAFANRSKYRSFLYFELYGRSKYRVPLNVTLVGRETIDGVDCYVLEFHPEEIDRLSSSKRTVKIWVDTSKGFCILKAEHYDNTGDRWTMVYENFRQYGEIWFPTVSKHIHRWPGGKLDRVNTYIVKEAQFNLDFPPDFFRVNPKAYLNQGLELRPDSEGLGKLLDKSPKKDELPNTPDPLLLACGPNSLLRICELLKIDTDFEELTQLSRFRPDRGTTLLGLRDAARYKGLNPKGIQANIKLLKKDKVLMPAIAYVKGNHFLVFEEVVSDGVLISDPANKYDRYLSFKELSTIWNGELLIFDYQPVQAKPQSIPLVLAEARFYDFGEALGGSEIKHTFKLKNIGQKPLKIEQVEQSCVCTATLVSKDDIPPGGFGIVEAVLKVPSENRQVEESINVYTNDPVQNKVTLILKGSAFVPITTFPSRLLLGSIQSKTPITKSLTVHQKGETQILGVRTDSDHLKATVVSAKADQITKVEVALLESTPVGPFSYNVLVDYRYEGKEATYEVLAFGEVLGAFTVSPKRFFFGLVEDKQTVPKTVMISSTNNQLFKITSVESNSAHVTTKITAQEDGVSYQLTATVQPEAPAGELSGEILVKTDSTVQPVIRVPFSGIISSKK